MTDICKKRLTLELKKVRKCPNPNVYIKPDPINNMKWYFIIHSLTDCDYAGGVYMGVVTVTSKYPMKAPTFQVFTPNGRFQPKTTLCTTFSHYHPEQWSPNWQLSTTLVGLVSFMMEDGVGIGSIKRSSAERKKLAKESIDHNYFDNDFKRIFVSDFPNPKYIRDKLQKIHDDAIILERKNAKEVTTPAPAPAPEPEPAPVPESSAQDFKKEKIIDTVVVAEMPLNTIIWMYLDSELSEDSESSVQFSDICKGIAKWSKTHGNKPTDYDGKITKKSVHAELKNIHPDRYIKGKCLQGFKLINGA